MESLILSEKGSDSTEGYLMWTWLLYKQDYANYIDCPGTVIKILNDMQSLGRRSFVVFRRGGESDTFFLVGHREGSDFMVFARNYGLNIGFILKIRGNQVLGYSELFGEAQITGEVEKFLKVGFVDLRNHFLYALQDCSYPDLQYLTRSLKDLLKNRQWVLENYRKVAVV